MKNTITKTHAVRSIFSKKTVWALSLLLLFSPEYISAAPESFSSETTHAIDQEQVIKGTILDAKTREPIIGAAVRVKGSNTQGTITDYDGNFSIRVKPTAVLKIALIGYKTIEVSAANIKSTPILMHEDSEVLDEVVITAYGTGQKKESVVGSIQTVRPTELQVPSSNLSGAFAGKLSGVVAYQRSGMPGSNQSDFFIRGISTISGVTSPLIVIDGIEASSGDLNSLDPEVIEGFSILKDATATAMYGTRGANGVMIVTTKKGADLDRPIIGFRVEANITTPTKKPKFVSGPRYMELYNEAVTSQGTGDVLFTKEQIDGTRLGLNPYVFPNVDWYDEIFNDIAFNQRANFNIRGGSSKITYFMNMSVNHETGMLKNRSKDFYSYSNNIDVFRFDFQNNIDFKMSESSKISLHLSASINDQTSPSAGVGNIYGSIMNTNPVDFPAFYPSQGDPWIRWGAFAGGNDQGATNPLHQATNGYNDSFASTVKANLEFDQKLDFITEGLKLNAKVSFKNWSQTNTSRSQGGNLYFRTEYEKDDDGNFIYEIKPIGTPSKPVLGTDRSTNGDRRIYFESSLQYNRMFGRHDISGMLLVNLDEFALNSGGGLINSLPRRKVGYAARATYGYDSRYMVEFNAGYNGSENFAKGKRFGFFPSVAAGWNISEEKFWESIKPILSTLKLRASYGLVGNDQIGGERFIYLSDITLQSDNVSFTTGYGDNKVSHKGPTYNRFENNSITWEVGYKTNIGLDLTLLRRLNITADVFQEIRKDIFQQKNSIPNYLGTAGTKIFGNLAEVKNYGFESAVNYNWDISKDLSMHFNGTFTYARNKVTKYDEAPGTRPRNSYIGHSWNTHYGYVSDGLYIDYADIANNPKSTIGNIAIAPGDIKYVDQPDKEGLYDGQIDSDDRVAMGYPTVPQIIYGFGSEIRYKQWDLGFFFQGAARTSLMMGGFHPFGTQYNRNVLKFVADNYWSETNQDINAAYPRLTKYDNNNNTAGSDFWLRNARFIKLKNVEIGYTYKNMRVYINGMNLLTFSPFKHWDPEMGGGAGLSYPTQRVFNIGLSMKFN